MKKLFSIVPTALLAAAMSTTAFAADITVTVEGTAVAWTDAKPFVNKDDRTLVPLRPIANALGLEVTWNDDTNTAAFTDGEQTVEFTVDSNKYHGFINDQDVHVYMEMDTKPVIADSRIYAPARYLAEFFLYEVGWEQATQTVIIEKAEGYEAEEENIQLPEVPAGEFAAAFPVTAEAGTYTKTYIAFAGVTLAEDPDIFEYSIDTETTLNGLATSYGFTDEYVEMDMAADLSVAPGTYPVTFTIPKEFFSDAKEDIVVSTTLTVTAPTAASIMTKVLEDLEWGLYLAPGSHHEQVIESIAEGSDWMLEDTPFELTVTNGDFINNEDGSIAAFSCTLTVTNTETSESTSVDNVEIPLEFSDDEF